MLIISELPKATDGNICCLLLGCAYSSAHPTFERGIPGAYKSAFNAY